MLACIAAMAQEQSPNVVSPEVSKDGHITFRIYAPKASEVILNFDEFTPEKTPLSKDARGVWSVTIGPKPPEIYHYSFIVDGMRAADLQNPRKELPVQVEVPSDPPRFDQVRNVPHGTVSIVTYSSGELQRGAYIYLPPDYAASNKKYPVLYLFHGGGGWEGDWTIQGRTEVILDNLIADKKAVPMIVVMPNNVATAPARGTYAPQNQPQEANGSYDAMRKDLFGALMPYVEKNYRVIANRENRAMAGLSAGGGTTLNVGLNAMDKFAWIGEFSTGLFGGAGPVGGAGAGGGAGYAPYEPMKVFPQFYSKPEESNKELKLFYMSVGTLDPRLPFQQKARDDFQAKGIHLVFQTYEGAHVWKVWRHSLADFAPRLFR
jgi:enterochelin esterase family protein